MATTPDTVAGDAVRIEDTERLDNVDAGALQGLTYEHIIAAFGALVGPSSGVLSNPTFNVSNLSAVVIGECLLYDGRIAGAGKLATGTFIPYNPADAWQSTNTTVNLSPYLAGSGTPYIWATRVQVVSEAASRRKWVTGVGEQSYSPYTRLRERVEWAVGDAAPSSDYFKVAQIVSWASGAPLILPLHAFDLTTEATNKYGERLTAQTVVLGNVGLARAITTIIRTLRVHYDATAADASTWFTAPARGLTQLDAAVTANTASIVTRAEISDDPAVLFTGKVSYNPSTSAVSIAGKAYAESAGGAAPVVTEYGGGGAVEVNWSTVAAWADVYAVHVTSAAHTAGVPYVSSEGAGYVRVTTAGTGTDNDFFLTVTGRFTEAA